MNSTLFRLLDLLPAKLPAKLPEPESKSDLIIVAIVILVVLIALTIISILLYKHKKNTDIIENKETNKEDF